MVGLAAHPFTADGIALAGFLAGLAAGQYDPGVFTSSPGNVFEGRDVTAVALQVPDADLGGTRIAVWARISLFGHAPQLQVSRIGQAMLRPLFFSPPDAESETLNAGAPASDTDAHGKRVLSIVGTAARLAGLADPDAHADQVLAACLPDAVRYQPGQPAPFSPAVATGAHLMTTPSTSPWPSWPGRRSGTPPSRGHPPQSSLPVRAQPGGVAGARRPVRPPRTWAGVAERHLAVPVLRRRPGRTHRASRSAAHHRGRLCRRRLVVQHGRRALLRRRAASAAGQIRNCTYCPALLRWRDCGDVPAGGQSSIILLSYTEMSVETTRQCQAVTRFVSSAERRPARPNVWKLDTIRPPPARGSRTGPPL